MFIKLTKEYRKDYLFTKSLCKYRKLPQIKSAKCILRYTKGNEAHTHLMARIQRMKDHECYALPGYREKKSLCTVGRNITGELL